MQAGTRGADAVLARTGRARQVLIIDDDPRVAKTIVKALKDRYRVHLAMDDREGLAVLRSHPIDLLVLEVRRSERRALRPIC